VRWLLSLAGCFALLLPLTLLTAEPMPAPEPEAPPPPAFPTKWPPAPAAAPQPLPWKVDHKLYAAADASRAAALDIKEAAAHLSPVNLTYIRYLSIHNVPAELRPLYAECISLLINELSREPNLVIPPRIGPDGILIRLNLRDYGITPEAWDKLGDVDPYFHQEAVEKQILVKQATRIIKEPYEVEEKVLVDSGKGYYVEQIKKVTKYREREVADTATTQDTGKDRIVRTPGAAWLDKDAVALLLRYLYPVAEKQPQVPAPLLRGDWWLVTASLPPFYYDLLGLKTLDDAKDLALFDRRAKRFTQAKATVVFSGSGGITRRVARNNRIMEYEGTIFGGFWQTFDFKTSIKKQNVINNFLNEERDGGEIIFALPNGLQGYFLINGKNERVDEVPIDIAIDSTNQDARVRCGRSCMTCHLQGIQPFQSDFKVEVGLKTLVDLGIKYDNPEQAEELVRDIRRVFEAPDFRAIVRLQNNRFNTAVRVATGKTAAAMATQFLQVYDDYAEVPMDADRLVYEAGISDLDVQAAIKVQLNGTNNGVLLRRLLQPPLAIRRDQWEESYGDFMLRVLAWQEAKRRLNLQPVKEDKP
jgi:hypothetical protein